jgi:hypothetical protein
MIFRRTRFQGQLLLVLMLHFKLVNFNNMKTKYYILILLVTLGLGSCKKFLETKPSDFVDPKVGFETAEQLNFALAGVYNTLGSGGLYGSFTQYMYAWVGDEGYMVRSTLIGQFNYAYDATSPTNVLYWTDLYNGINRANVFLANVDNNPGLDQSLRDRLRGEVLFLRGFFYFHLVQYYGGVPLRITPSASVVDVHIPRASIKEVYDQILSDMTAAEALVPGIKAIGFGGRVSKSAVRGILARVCLHMAGNPLKDVSKYQDAKNWAKKVMDDGEAGHDLNPSYPDVFIKLAADQYDIKENIFEAEFWGNKLDSYVETGNQGWINGPVVSATSTTTGRADGYMRATAKLYNVFEPGDNRKWWSISHFVYDAPATATAPQVPNGSKTLYGLPANEGAKYGIASGPILYLPAKFRREYEILTPKGTTQTPQNVPLLRYADVLLMYAEAENEVNGPTQDAVDAVNKVRRRGWSTGVKAMAVTNGGTGYYAAPVVTVTGGGGSGATAVATVAGGKVTAVTLSRDLTGVKFSEEGSNYTSAPTITIAAPSIPTTWVGSTPYVVGNIVRHLNNVYTVTVAGTSKPATPPTHASGSSTAAATGAVFLFAGVFNAPLTATATATIHMLSDAEVKTADKASPAAFRSFIQAERMRELNFEVSRKADLHRWGIFFQTMQDVGNTFRADFPGANGMIFSGFFLNALEPKHEFWPIPTVELTRNRAIVQNPGWN